MIAARSRWLTVQSVSPLAAALVAVVLTAVTGCKTGTAGAKPSWWSFGGTPSSTSTLAAAPSFPGSVEKPSASAKPYPTTTTPNGYVLTEGSKTGGQPAAPQIDPAASVAAVTYGSTPPPAAPAAPAASMAGAGALPTTAAADAGTPSSPMSSIAPQVGPYASLAAEPTATAPAYPAAAAASPAAYPAVVESSPAATSLDATLPTAQAPTQRLADARGAEGWTAPPSPPTAGQSRYAATNGSRFGGVDAAVAPAASFPPASSAAIPAPLEPLPAAAAPAAMPAVIEPAMVPGGYPAVPPAAPLTPSSPLTPASPPARRPDPGYRPGGTSSYRPSRAILAGDAPDAGGAVLPVGYDAAAAGP